MKVHLKKTVAVMRLVLDSQDLGWGFDSSVLPATKEVGSGNRNGLQLEGYLNSH